MTTGAYLGGRVAAIITTKLGGGDEVKPTSTDNYHRWRDSAGLSGTNFDPDTGHNTLSDPVYYNGYLFDGSGHVTHIDINDGRPRTVEYRIDANGQILSREEVSDATNDPISHYYYFLQRNPGR